MWGVYNVGVVMYVGGFRMWGVVMYVGGYNVGGCNVCRGYNVGGGSCMNSLTCTSVWKRAAAHTGESY